MNDMFEVPLTTISTPDMVATANVSRVVGRSRPHNRRFQAGSSQAVRLRRRANDFDQMLGHDKLPLPDFIEEPNTLGPEFVVEAASEYRRIRIDSQRFLHRFIIVRSMPGWAVARPGVRAIQARSRLTAFSSGSGSHDVPPRDRCGKCDVKVSDALETPRSGTTHTNS